ncbi:MAG: response regulator transcription factor [Myxococcales bacterium]|nr:response regulator transcription factor [Myxococcales bacterium]
MAEGDSAERRFLVAEDDALMARAVARQLERFADVRVVSSLSEARAAYRRGHALGLLVDVALPDGSGLDFADEVRRADCLTPILIMTGLEDRDLANRAHRLRASFIRKPFGHDDIGIFAERALADHERISALARVGAELAARHGLSPSEAGVLRLTLEGHDVLECAEALGIQVCTVRAHRAAILRKTCFATMVGLLQTALRRAAVAAAPVNERVRTMSGVRPAGSGYATGTHRPIRHG